MIVHAPIIPSNQSLVPFLTLVNIPFTNVNIGDLPSPTLCVHNITPDRGCYSTYKAGDHGYVKMGNEDACKIVGIRDLHLLTLTSYRMVLKEVRYVLDIRLNLISTRRLDEEGYNGTFWIRTWKFCKGSLIVARARKRSTLYVLHACLNWDQVNAAIDTVGELWHKRLCHMSQTGMQMLAE